MSTGRPEAKFKEDVEALIQDFENRAAATAPAAYAGAKEETILEHTARKYFLDKFIHALGWDTSSFDHDIVEEARVRAETTVFMDYLGVHPTSRAPVLIFEAKAWDKPMIGASAAGLAKHGGEVRLLYKELISLGLKHCKAGEDETASPVTSEWRGWLQKLIQYVTAVKDQSGYQVDKVAISSGKWLVVFNSFATTFCSASGSSIRRSTAGAGGPRPSS